MRRGLRCAHAEADWKKSGGGGGEIRTHEGLPLAGFQDRCLKPLGHASALTFNNLAAAGYCASKKCTPFVPAPAD